MPKYNWARIVRGLLLDCAIWFSAPAIFLYFYIVRCGMPSSAIVPHLRYVGAALVALLCVRAVLALPAAAPRLRRVLVTALISSALLLLLAYYFMVIVGLQSWNRVVSWRLVAGYLTHLGELAATLEITPLKAGATLMLLTVPVLLLVWLYLKKCDWLTPAVQASAPTMLAFCLGSACLLSTLQAVDFLNWPAARQFEPFAMTIFPEQTVSKLAENEVDQLRAAALDRQADQERARYQPNLHATMRNVVLIVVDALRADHMGLYGYERDTTPNLSRLARDGNLQKLTDMRATCAETVCGLLSLYSSKFVPDFSAHPFTLHEVLRRHGYAIHVILGGDHTNFYGMTKIYGDVDSFFDGSMAKGTYPNDDRFVIEKTAALPAWNSRPTLVQLHLMSAHILGKRNPGSGHFSPAKNYIGTPNAYTASPGTVSPLAQNYYDNGVVQADDTIGKLLASLEGKGYLSNTLVVITADHGDALGEHGLYTHANGVLEPLLRIPFIMIAYGDRAAPLPSGLSNTSQVDIAPILVEELGMPRPATWSGSVPRGAAHAYSFFDQADLHGLVDQRAPAHVWKYWSDRRTREEFAFDLGADPGEAHNLIGSVAPALKNTWRRKLLSPSR